ncbi:hypothetical protein D6855_14855 [Butyrivibrio sp. CB08]|uniref:InlB B-repeat-containing protein n=1 Tax=Butyrivibrio sp. CB08 TaxID=2364879 RepID=UPI000EAA2115|nr:InlB B-repeat-containing protein [Butyrivibrio sp. CB08]RKM56138.1 hypothetical protein D6855_14855 [Butyrivibrio sp. CB08]
MFRKWNRVLAFLLSIALITTTFGSDFASAKVYAETNEITIDEDSDDSSEPSISELSFSEEKPDVEEPKVEEPKVEEPKVEEPKAEEPKAEEPKLDEDPIDPIAERKIAVPGEGLDLTKGLLDNEENAEEGEDDAEYYTITYKAGPNGSVKPETEKIKVVEGEDLEASGSEAEADEGYTCVNWTDEDGNVVSTSATFTPSADKDQIFDGAVYTANFEQSDFTVTYVIKDKEGNESVYQTQGYEKNDGLSFPEAPFKSGYFFRGWKYDGESISAGTPVTSDMKLVADLEEIKIFEVCVKYVYEFDGKEHPIGEQTVEIEKSELKDGKTKSIISPSSISVEEGNGIIYYPEKSSIEITEADLEVIVDVSERDGSVPVGILEDRIVHYVDHDVTYDVVYMLKNLKGEGYTEQTELRESVFGKAGTTVTPEVKNIEGFIYEKADSLELKQEAGQEVKIYYTRSNLTLQFDTCGGDYVNSMTELYGTKIDLSKITPTYNGHTFEGWYENYDEEKPEAQRYSDKVEGLYELKNNTVLFAKWKAGKAEYRVIFMAENADDDGYSVVTDGIKKKEGTIDTEVTWDPKDNNDKKLIPANSLTFDDKNFTFKEASKEILKADGSTVVTVKYDRKKYKIVGYDKNGNKKNPEVSIEAKYGADIYDAFQETFNKPYTNGCWSVGVNDQLDKKVSFQTMPSPHDSRYNQVDKQKGIIKAFYYDFASGAKKQTLRYWLEGYDSETKETKNGKTYGLYSSVESKFLGVYYTSEFYNIDGYKQAGVSAQNKVHHGSEWVSTGFWFWEGYWSDPYDEIVDVTYAFENWSPTNNKVDVTSYEALTLNMYYDAETYQVTFVDYDGTTMNGGKPISVKAGTNLGGNPNYLQQFENQSKANMAIKDAVWDGWKTDATRQAAYTPEGGKYTVKGGLILYANYTFPDRIVTFVDPFNPKDHKTIDTQTVKHGETASPITCSVTHTGYTFDGWYAEASCENVFDFHLPITETGIKVYAKWKPDQISYTVKYLQYFDDPEHEEVALSKEKVVTHPDFKQGMVITEKALNIVGYYSDVQEKKHTLDYGENTIIFYYKNRPETIDYTVKYLYKESENADPISVAKTVVRRGVKGSTASVTENAAAVDKSILPDNLKNTDFYPEQDVLTYEFTYEDVNPTIVFYYHPYKMGRLTVHYVDMDGDEIVGTEPETMILPKGSLYTINANVTGYVKNRVTATLGGNSVSSKVTITEGETERYVYMQKLITIKASDKIRDFNGNNIVDEYDSVEDLVTVEGLKGDDKVSSVEFTGDELIYAGSTSVTPKNAVIERNGVQDFYKITYVAGTATVIGNIAVNIWVTYDHHSEQYDGIEHTVTYHIDSDNALIKNNPEEFLDITGTKKVLKSKDVFEKESLDVQFKIKDKYSSTFTPAFAYGENGYLEITKREIKVTTESKSWTYDGQAHTWPQGSIADGSFVEGEGGEIAGFTTASSVTNVSQGEVANEITGIDFNSNTKASNYTWSYATKGTLTVTPKAITINITGHSDSVKYDGESHTISGYDAAFATGTGNVDYKLPAENVSADFTGPTVTRTETNYSADDYLLGLTEGTFTPENPSSQFTNNNTNYAVTFVVVDGKLTISKTDEIVVNVVGASETKTYNGKEQSISGYTIEVDKNTPDALKKLFKKNNVKVNVDGVAKGTTVNTDGYKMGLDGENAVKYTDPNLTVRFVITDGVLTITPATIKVNITGNTESKVYIGKEQSVEGYAVEILDGDNKKVDKNFYNEDSFTFTGNKKANGTAVATYEMGLSTNQFKSKDETNYTVTFNVLSDGKLTITKRKVAVTVTGRNLLNQQYTGSEQSVNGYDISIDETANNDGLKIYSDSYMNKLKQDDPEVTAKGTNAGTYEMTFTADNFTNNDENFDVTVTPVHGKLVIIKNTGKVTVYVTGNKLENQPYTGSEKRVEGYSYTIKDSTGAELTDEQKKSIIVSLASGKQAIAKGTNAGTYYMGLTAKHFTYESINYSNVEFATPVDGFLTIIPATRPDNTYPTVTPETKVYDGDPHTFTISGGITTGDKVDSYKFSYRNVTDSSVKPTATDVTGENGSIDDVKIIVHNDNYEDIELSSSITITPRTLKVKTGSHSWPFDGEYHKWENAEFITDADNNIGFVKNESASVNASFTIRDVGGEEHNNTYNASDIVWAEGTKEDNYTVVADTNLLGTLTITNNTIAVTFTAPDAEKQYDGTELTSGNKLVVASATSQSMSEDELKKFLARFDFVASAKPSSSMTSYVEAHKINVEDNVYNVVDPSTVAIYLKSDTAHQTNLKDWFDGIGYAYGTLTITPAELNIQTEDATRPYNGEALRAGATITAKNDKETVDSTLTVAADFKDGKFEKEITLVNGEKVKFVITGAQTEVNTDTPHAENNTYEIVWGNVKNSNYNVNATKGTLTVGNSDAKIVVSVNGNGTEEVYNGEEHWATVTVGNTSGKSIKDVEVKSDTATFTVTASVSDKSYAVNATGNNPVDAKLGSLKVVNASGTDVTEALKAQNAIEIVEGQKIVVNPATLIVKTEDAEKEYDGLPLKGEGDITGFVGNEKEGVTFTVTGNVTDVNSDKPHNHNNTYTLTFNKGGVAKESNYIVDDGTKEGGKGKIGTLTVKPNTKNIVLKALSDHKTYDGHKLTANGITEESLKAFPNSDGEGMFTVVATVEGEVTHVAEGKVDNEIKSFVIKKGNDDVTDFFTGVTTDKGELYITPKTITVQTDSATKKYDGIPLSAPGRVKGLVGEETATVTTSKTVTYVDDGVVDNDDYTITWDTAAETDYVEGEPEIGTLQILARSEEEKLRIVAYPLNKDDSVYNGKIQDEFDYRLEFEDIQDAEPDVVTNDNESDDNFIDNAVDFVTNGFRAIGNAVLDLLSISAGAVERNGSYDKDGRVFNATADVQVVADREAKNVGEYVLTMDEDSLNDPTNLTVVDGAGKDVSDQFKLVAGEPASFTITHATAYVTAENASKVQNTADPAKFTAVVSLPEEYEAYDNYAELLAEAQDTIEYTVSRKAGEAVTTYEIIPEGEPVQGNFNVEYVNGTFTITAAPDDDTPTGGDTTIPDAPVALAPGAVLGAQRGIEDGPAVLGARRAGTDDPYSMGRVFALVVAAALAVTVMITGKKKEEEEEG